MAIANKDLPGFVRRCYDQARKANQELRAEERTRLRFYAGGDLQWRPEEIQKRTQAGRPWITINKVKPAVDQIEGDIRMNPPGPQCHPVGGGADSDTADIISGLIRETEYRSNTEEVYPIAGRYLAISGYSVIELATEYVDDRSWAQRPVIKLVEDPFTVYFDPAARGPHREDAMWAMKIKMYGTPESYAAAFGKNSKVLQSRGTGQAIGWLQEAMGIDGSLAMVNEWTGMGKGPFYVAEFYEVELDERVLRLYSDNIARFDDEEVPRGVVPKPGKEYTREVQVRTVRKSVVDALEVKDQTDWKDGVIPLFPAFGPEVWIEGKLYRGSTIAGGLDSQRALNFIATSATEIAGFMPKAPWMGAQGQFDDERWQTANTEMWAYLEYKPIFAHDPASGAATLVPPPQRTPWEAPIQWLIALWAQFSDSIKAATGIYDPSLGAQKGDQSGKAIEQLRSESNVGTYSARDSLHGAIARVYQSLCRIYPKLYDGPRAQSIIRADTSHELVEINRDFSETNGIDPATNKQGKSNNIALGEYSVRVTVGKSQDTRQDQAIDAAIEYFKVNPQTLQNPAVGAQFLRWIGEGDPKIEALADLIAPSETGEMTPQQMQTQMQQAQMTIKQQGLVIQKLQQAIEAKLPEIEQKKFDTLIKSLTSIRVAEINATKGADAAGGDAEAAQLETLLGMAHEAGMQATDHAHEKEMQSADHAHAAVTQASDQQAQQQQAEQEAAVGGDNA